MSVFETQVLPLNQVLRCILRDDCLWRTSMQKQQVQPGTDVNVVDGSSPSRVHVAVDGSWNPQLGRMGCAAVLRDKHGNWISATSVSYGHGSSFLAELKAVELGLKEAVAQGFRVVECKSDCLQVVEALQPGCDLSGYWDREYISQVLEHMRNFQRSSVSHITRDRNNTADTFAREASMLGSPLQVWSRPPSFVYASLFLDAVS